MRLETRHSRITVTQLLEPDAMLGLQEMQREIWGYGEPGADPPYPSRALFAISESGGLVSMAAVDGVPAGFGVAWIGRIGEPPSPYLHSQLVGVRPEFRRQGVGMALKLHQRAFALTSRLTLVRWTFDPLRAANARFNLGRLGAVCLRFQPHFYGHLGNRFSAGDQSDRLWAEWYVDSDRVESRIAPGREIHGDASVLATTCRPVVHAGQDVMELVDWDPDLDDGEIGVEIPVDFELIRAVHEPLARKWRMGVREILEHYLGTDRIVSDLCLAARDGQLRAFYILSRCGLESALRGA